MLGAQHQTLHRIETNVGADINDRFSLINCFSKIKWYLRATCAVEFPDVRLFTEDFLKVLIIVKASVSNAGTDASGNVLAATITKNKWQQNNK